MIQRKLERRLYKLSILKPSGAPRSAVPADALPGRGAFADEKRIVAGDQSGHTLT
jgi:hypothetical protein